LRARRSGVRLEGDGPMVEELLFLSHVVGWWYVVSCALFLFGGGVCVVVCASTCYVPFTTFS
jgi:hypothetical protein